MIDSCAVLRYTFIDYTKTQEKLCLLIPTQISQLHI
jgi:hypothetical protein